jgi:hypothetical protein
MSLNVSAVVVDSAVASVIFALGVAWAPVVVMVSAVSGVPAAAVLTAVDVPEAKTLLWLGSLLFCRPYNCGFRCYCCFQGFCVLDVVGVFAVLGVPGVAGV